MLNLLSENYVIYCCHIQFKGLVLIIAYKRYLVHAHTKEMKKE